MRTLLIVPAVVAGFAVGVAQAEEPPPGPPRPAPEMAQLEPLLGSWKCSGKVNASPFGPEHPMRTSVSGKLEMNGFWAVTRINEQKTKDNPVPVAGVFLTTYDAASKKFNALWYDNFGGWGTSTSAGWEGDKISFTGDTYFGGQKIASRDTFTKKGDRELAHTGEMMMDGKWVVLAEETCRRR